MFTYLDITAHIIFSTLAGLLVWKNYYPRDSSKLKIALFLAFISGVLIDVDHLVDYYLAFGSHFDYNFFMSASMFTVSGKNYVPFHAFEYAIPLLYFFYRTEKKQTKMILLTLLVSMLFHLGVDIGFGVPPRAYFITHRILNHFNTELGGF